MGFHEEIVQRFTIIVFVVGSLRFASGSDITCIKTMVRPICAIIFF